MSWLKKKADPQAQLEMEVLRQWQANRLVDRLAELPADLLLNSQYRRLQRIEEDVLAATGSLPVRRRLKRLIWQKIGSVKILTGWISRRHCLQPARRLLIRTVRRLLLKLLTMALRRLHQQYLGKLRTSASSLMKPWPAPNNPASSNAKLVPAKPDFPNRQ